jgi:hypothetical protein
MLTEGIESPSATWCGRNGQRRTPITMMDVPLLVPNRGIQLTVPPDPPSLSLILLVEFFQDQESMPLCNHERDIVFAPV